MLALLAVGVLAACEPEPYVGHPTAPKMAVVGDSLTLDIEDAAIDRFTDDGWAVSVTAFGGYTLRDHQDTLQRAVGTGPEVLVVALGSNDIREFAIGHQDLGGYRDLVRATLATARDVPCVVWVGVNTTSGYWGPGGDHVVYGPWVNLMTSVEITASGRAPGRTFLADWASRSAGRHDYFVAPGDVHHTSRGSRAFLDLIADTVAQCPPRATLANLDAVVARADSVTVAGWAKDQSDPHRPTQVEIVVDGRLVATVPADGRRSDVARVFPHLGAHTGFSATVPAEPGLRRVCARAVDSTGARARPLGCATVTVPEPPTTSSTTTTTTIPEPSTTTTTTTTTVEAPTTTTSTSVPEPSTTSTTAEAGSPAISDDVSGEPGTQAP
ncbi:SGNH/GDSL hydrolase family protein [Rhabdothermincola salaria]|uniref:SGNH/GDSL hydrolase family protein n=1 Tax=Rhabdothermincola salaria TaxID=2903142 RepID=UPI001E3DCBA4|nr:SGNH/GDSL hydrolase family protein [Rhabdothermincola salaria]MCD9622804.1 SGNH/GDSL hydrolase family protein [Rhabdothermincola salaria]